MCNVHYIYNVSVENLYCIALLKIFGHISWTAYMRLTCTHAFNSFLEYINSAWYIDAWIGTSTTNQLFSYDMRNEHDATQLLLPPFSQHH